MPLAHMIMAAAAVWRITHLLQVEDGPFTIFSRLREKLRKARLAGAMDCFYCLSLWVAAPFALALSRSLLQAAMLALALSTGAIVINRIVEPSAPALYFEPTESKENLPCPAAAMPEIQGS